jgi:protein SCO1/2
MRLPFTSLALVLLLNGVKAVEKPVSFEGTVLEQKANVWSVKETKPEEKTLTVKVGDGDAKIAWQGRKIKGELVSTDTGLRVDTIFPVEAEAVRQIAEVSDALHRETMDKGRLVTRLPNDLMPDMALWDQDAKLVFKRDFLGAPLAVNFIFTSCRSAKMCPASTQSMKRLGDELDKRPTLKSIRLVTITFDPETDSPGVLKAYAEGYGIRQERHRFLTGDAGQIKDLMRQYGILTVRDDGTIVHNTALVLISAEGRIVERRDGAMFDAVDVADTLQMYAARPRK